MEKEIISRLEKLLDRELDTEEKERLQRIKDTLQIGDNDVLRAVISAMEYQRTYYEKLPEKISSVTEKILAERSTAAEKEVRFAQSRLAEKCGEAGRETLLEKSYPLMADMGNRRTFSPAALRKLSDVGRILLRFRTGTAA